MFEKLRDKSLSPSQERFDTIIGRTTQIYGRLVLLDSVRIDGKVVGNIETTKDNKVTVAIGKTGEVSGDITAHRVMVAGKVEGNIYAAERVCSTKTRSCRAIFLMVPLPLSMAHAYWAWSFKIP